MDDRPGLEMVRFGPETFNDEVWHFFDVIKMMMMMMMMC